jgi:hypothetical protein
MIVVRRGNVRSSKSRGGDVRCGTVRYWGHGGSDVRYGETWGHVRSGRRKMGCRRNHWPLRFRISHESREDEGYRTNGNRSHDHKPQLGYARSLFISPVHIGSAGRETEPAGETP